MDPDGGDDGLEENEVFDPKALPPNTAGPPNAVFGDVSVPSVDDPKADDVGGVC